MKTQSTTAPNPITIFPLPKNQVQLQLIKNIEEKIVDSDTIEGEQSQIIYEFDQIIFNTFSRPNIREDIETNFDYYWTLGEDILLKKQLDELKQTRINQLIKNKFLPDELDSILSTLVEQEFEITLIKLEA